jgi:hypothetical protein
MLFPRVLRIIVIDILAASTVLGWRHVSKTQLLSTVSQNDVVLVACKLSYENSLSEEYLFKVGLTLIIF